MNDLTIYRGDDKDFTIHFKDAVDADVDITGWKVYFTVKKNESDVDVDAVITKDITSHTDPTGGDTKISLVGADTEDLAGNYYYDIQVKKTGGTVFTIVKGTFIVTKDITLRTT